MAFIIFFKIGNGNNKNTIINAKYPLKLLLKYFAKIDQRLIQTIFDIHIPVSGISVNLQEKLNRASRIIKSSSLDSKRIYCKVFLLLAKIYIYIYI